MVCVGSSCWLGVLSLDLYDEFLWGYSRQVCLGTKTHVSVVCKSREFTFFCYGHKNPLLLNFGL